MSHSLRADLPSPQRKAFARASLRGETDRNFLADANLGPVIERIAQLEGLNHDQLARMIGYPTSSSVSRWIAGVEGVVFARLWAVQSLRQSIVLALAEDQSGVETSYVLTAKPKARRQA